MSPLRNWLFLLPAPVGGVLLFLGERVLGGSPLRPYLSGLGILALSVALGMALLRLNREPRAGAGARIWSWMALPPILFLLAVGLYFAQQGLAREPYEGMDWASLAGWGWMLAALFGAVWFVLLALALLAQPPHPDARRIRAAASAGLRLGLVLALAVTLNFIFDRLPWQWDLAYFRTTQPSQATREVVEGLHDPVDAALFFTADSPVGALVNDYFHALVGGGGAGQLKVASYDADLKPGQAESYRVRGNGWVVLRRGGVRKSLRVGDTLESARSTLRKLDETVLARLLELSRDKRVVYYTVGHGEHLDPATPSTKPEDSFRQFRAILTSRNYQLKPLGLSEGSASDVPSDAALVVVAGAREPFLAPEAQALRRYLDGGGRLLAYLDPETPGTKSPSGASLGSVSMATLLAHYGIEFVPAVQANDRIYGRRTFTAADHALLITVRYLSHPSVGALRAGGARLPLLFLDAGALKTGKAPPGEVIQGTIQAMPGTWSDVNGNFLFDSGVERRDLPLLAMAEAPRNPPRPPSPGKKPGTQPNPPTGPTLLVFADTDVASDLLLQNRANRLALEEGLAWVAGTEPPAALPTSEEDVRIRHAKGDDWLWFYLPVFGVPALVLLVGIVMTGRRRRRQGGAHG